MKQADMPGISIKNILNSDGKEKETTPATPTVSVIEAYHFSQNELTAGWKEYTQTIPEKTILINTILSCTPVLKENFTIEIPVDSPIQEKELLSEQADLLAFLSKRLKNGKIKIHIRINAQGENKKSLTPFERFKSMLERNPNIEHLRVELGLELD